MSLVNPKFSAKNSHTHVILLREMVSLEVLGLLMVVALWGVEADNLVWSDEFNSFNLDTWKVF